MNEQDWNITCFNNINRLRQLVHEQNNKLIISGSRNRVISGFIDAVDLDEIKNLSTKVDQLCLVTEQMIQPPSDNVCVVRVPDSFFGLYFNDLNVVDYPIKKQFNCLLNRVDPIRQSWFYFLYDRGMLDQGYVSFNLSMRKGLTYPVNTPEEYFEWIHATYLSFLDRIKLDIKKIVPYRNFPETDDLSTIILSSKFSIILETYAERSGHKCFSEKIFRALHFPRPWLLFAGTGCVERLRNLGFDVFDDYVDHSYDMHETSENCVARQDGIFDQCKKLFDLKITPDILQDWHNKANHNREILRRWNKTYIDDFKAVLSNKST